MIRTNKIKLSLCLHLLRTLLMLTLVILPVRDYAGMLYHCTDQSGHQTFSDYPLKDQMCREMMSDEEEKKTKEPDKAIESHRGSSEKKITRLISKENGIVVPATLVYEGREAEIRLILDTGASATTIYDNVADRLYVNLHTAQKAQGRVVGGGTIDARVVKFNYLRIGPNVFRDWNIFVVQNKDYDAAYDGLLGMDILSTMRYKIDLKNQVIIWE